MTGDGAPSNPSVLNTTVLSNFAYVDQLWVVAGLSGICTVPIVREELENGVDDHPYLRSALDALDDQIPVATVSDAVANREAIVSDHLDPGEAQAFALADARDGRLLTDDGDARSFAKDQGVTVVGSVGVLLAAIDAGKIDEPTADEWLSTWIDEIGYYVPYRTIGEYR
ncbi:PIN domain containing protein [Halalkaliarchaeum sp. AArc-CO]|uniref:twitching motility protein PilT n=1 Tax=Halalkaliarchaeum sp. AArc-CO TaxID=2866381 RepID=UPI00217D37DC|nr:twitching motility protein PilT [Halalkaliarchaeum sp. AArc-CO]UWG51997.1 PIN domain containing protein [Halalkaliarchaeum sp. AArc-CO]